MLALVALHMREWAAQLTLALAAHVMPGSAVLPMMASAVLNMAVSVVLRIAEWAVRLMTALVAPLMLELEGLATLV